MKLGAPFIVRGRRSIGQRDQRRSCPSPITFQFGHDLLHLRNIGA
jgi:hypothetical protein